MNTKMYRRKFLQSGLTWGTVGTGLLGMLGRQSDAQVALPGTKKLLFIFQRGGNDGINTVIPHGDNHYNTTTRPSLYISPAESIDLGNGFASLHPAMAPAMDVFNANGSGVPGDLAVIHRVAYSNQSRSHFDSQDYWERGVPGGGPGVKDGMFYRQLAVSTDLSDPTNAFLAASLSSNGLLALKGDTPFPNFNRASEFGFLGSSDEQQKFRGMLPGGEGGDNGRGVLGLYSGTGLGGRTPSGVVHGRRW